MSVRRKLKRAVGVAQLLGWILFGASCGASKPEGDAVLRSLLDVIEIVCPPEITVGDCTARVKAWLPLKGRADAGAGG